MTFVKVAEAAEVPVGEGKVCVVGGAELALFQVDGQFYCIGNLCPHADGPLGEGYITGDCVACPWHAWEFSIKTGKMLYNPEVSVQTYACKMEDGSVFVDV